MPSDAYSTAGFDHHTYMAVALIGVQTGGVVGSDIHDSLHACVYVRSSSDVYVHGNSLARCGGSRSTGGGFQPAVYIFQSGAVPTTRIHVQHNQVFESGAALFNTRISEHHDEYRTAWLTDIDFEFNYAEDDDGDFCVLLRGVRGGRVRGNTCVRTGGIVLSTVNEQFCSDNGAVVGEGMQEGSCVEDVRIEYNTLLASRAFYNTGFIGISDFHERIAVVNNRVYGGERLGANAISSLKVQMPVRDLRIGDIDLLRCDGHCLEFAGRDMLDAPLEEGVIVSQVDAQGASSHARTRSSHACFRLRARLEHAMFFALRARDCTDAALRADRGLANSYFLGFDFDGRPNGYAGALDLSVDPMPACDAFREDRWIVAMGSDGSCSGAAGASGPVRCACQAGGWRPWNPRTRAAIDIRGASDLQLSRGKLRNVDGGAGIRFRGGVRGHVALNDIVMQAPTPGSGVLFGMNRGVWDDSGGASDIQAGGIVCEPGALMPDTPCVDLPGVEERP
jgi:hypothetical protein